MPKSGLFLQKPKVYQNVYLNLIYIIKIQNRSNIILN
jgi:hypothetical protein